MMLSYSEACKVFEWYCSLSTDDPHVVIDTIVDSEKALKTVGLVSIHDKGHMLYHPDTSFLKIVNQQKFCWFKLKHGI